MTFVTALRAAAVAAPLALFAALPAKAADIVDTAASNDSFSTLVAAVKAAGLVDTLKGEGPFTVFAPTNQAFDALPDGTVDMLLKPENKEKLIEILTYHVVPGKVMSGDLDGEMMVETVNGAEIKVVASDTGVMVDNATVTQADLEADNGVIHVIDAVVMPSDAM
jgi:uncharacterized surface protein with fasciclin (FAS1) repeats